MTENITGQDDYNAKLISRVHPEDWENPVPDSKYDLVVIGAGTAGLVSAAGAVGLGARVALIERHLLGGDCLNYGCVPSKALIRSSRAMADATDTSRFGVETRDEPAVDFPAVMERVRRIRAGISKNDSAKRFTEMGVDVFFGDAEFAGKNKVEVKEEVLTFGKAVIATGASPFKPPVEGLSDVDFRTSETIFELKENPGRLVIIGAGPIGCELAQAFSRLGVRVTLMDRNSQILKREDEDAAEILQNIFLEEGVELVLNCEIKRVEEKDAGKIVHYESNGKENSAVCDEILLGTGRTPNVNGLNLETAGVNYDKRKGVAVNEKLQTTNPDIFSAGDVCMKYKFTHAADAAARIVIRNAFFPGGKKLSTLTIPWCTYTDPEIAHVGLYERDAKEKGIETNTLKTDLSDIDRAVADGETRGFAKIHLKEGSDKILGATIVARHAGEMISEITLALTSGIGLGEISDVIHPYPTQAEVIKHLADEYNRSRLTPVKRKILSGWFALLRMFR